MHYVSFQCQTCLENHYLFQLIHDVIQTESICFINNRLSQQKNEIRSLIGRQMLEFSS